jgi:hypothetical protein
MTKDPKDHARRADDADSVVNWLDRFDLRLISGPSAKQLPKTGQSQVIIALLKRKTNGKKEGLLHFKIFSHGNILVDESETDIPAKKADDLMKLKRILTPFPKDADISLKDGQKLVNDVLSIFGCAQLLDTEREGQRVFRMYGRLWWWRCIDSVWNSGALQDKYPVWHSKTVGLAGAFEREYQESAYLYELGMRFEGKYEFGESWWNLPYSRQQELAKRWPVKPTAPAKYPFKLKYKGERKPLPKGWVSLQDVWINLSRNDDPICNAFPKLLNHVRAIHGIPNPPQNSGGYRGLASRVAKFKRIEVLDLQYFGESLPEEDDDTNRKRVSTAEKHYKKSRSIKVR